MNDSKSFEIRNTEKGDLTLIYQFFDSSVFYQEKNGYPTWKGYDKNAILRDIENKNQYKVIMNNSIGIVFSVCYSDAIIWRTMDKNDSLYLHRIVVNPECKGKKLFNIVLDWAIGHASQQNRHSIRMDTWSANTRLIQYYQSFGFDFVENFTTPNSSELPVHNRNLPLALLEYNLK